VNRGDGGRRGAHGRGRGASGGHEWAVAERWAAIQAGACSGVSIGFMAVEQEMRQASNGRTGVH